MSENMKTGVEIERKYIIKKPHVDLLSIQNEYTKSEIVQIYITSAEGETHRIRRRDYGDRVQYIETRKIRIDSISVTEIEGEITEERFAELKKKQTEGSSPVLKTRHTFKYKGQIFEIDVYPQWHNTAIMETELESREERAEMPEFIEILKEVTGERIYSNASMSKAFPPEIHPTAES